MNMKTKQEVLQSYLKDWLKCKGNRKDRGVLTKQLSSVLKIHPKSVGRSMKRLQFRSNLSPPKKRGRKVYYDKKVDASLEKVWLEMDMICAENMHSMISEYIDYFIQANDWSFSEETTNKLKIMSLGTLKNKIAKMRKKRGINKGRSVTVSSPLKGIIPIRKSHTWQGLPPGYVQTDSVVHSGDLLTGDVIYSVGEVDFATYWSEYTTQWNKGMIITCDSLKTLKERFPFPLLEIHPDTGTEFINNHLLKWTAQEGIAMTRSEPYKKNDNMCIEERNGSIARKYLGYVRMDDKNLVDITSKIMKLACLLHNHFRPVRRMTNKQRINAKWKRSFEKNAKTPYQRVMEHPNVSKDIKEKLYKEHLKLNPLQLKKELDILITKLNNKLIKIKKSQLVQ